MKISVLVEDESGRKFHGEAVLKPQREGGRATHRTDTKAHPHVSRKRPSAPHAVRSLWEKGVFKIAQNFGAVEKELAELEYNFPKPTLMVALGRARFLTRQGTRGNYRWVQKYKAGT